MIVEYAIITPVVMGIVEIISIVDAVIPRNLLPAISLLVGVVIGVVVGLVNGDVAFGAMTGAAAGLSASGLYDVVTKTNK